MKLPFILLFLIATAMPLRAAVLAGDPYVENDWEWRVGIPGWITGVDGELGVRGQQVELDVEFKEILEHLDLVLAAAVEARYKRFVFFANFIYLDTSGSAESPRGIFFDSAEAKFAETLFEAFAGYRVWAEAPFYIDLYAGFRVTSLDAEISFHPSSKCGCFLTDRTFSQTETWVDPLIGARLRAPIWKPVSFVGMGDLGGFGAGSDFTWRIRAGLEFQITRNIYSFVGYQKLNADYQNGGFKWDTNTSGAYIECGISF